ncbi:MAG: HAD-IA family hydrolase [Clostridia bacterium]|nr:HAD-IA family hydrolase [Clostridia bacterium]
MSYRFAVFDMDGTILDTLTDLKNSLNNALQKNGLPARTQSEVRSFVGNGIRLLVQRGVPDGTPKTVTDRVFEDMNAHYALHCADTTAAYPGVKEALLVLRRHGLLTAVVSNKTDYAVQALCPQYFDGLFDATAGVQEGVRKKPYPDMVEAVMQRFCVPPEQTVYIGDSEVDLKTAENAGIDCLSVDWGFRTREQLLAAGAKEIFSDPAEVVKRILTP